jgi:hypothetical protein
MVTAQAIPATIIDDDIFEEVDKFEKRGNWTEERKEVLKNITGEEIDAEVMRLQAEHPERYLTPEELQKKIMRIQEARMAGRRAVKAGA